MLRYGVVLSLLSSLIGCHSHATTVLNDLHVSNEHQQLVLVTSQNWQTSNAQLQRYQRDKTGWVEIGSPIRVRLGRNGLGWGMGLHQYGQSGVPKQEGDGKAPAGMFALNTAFGYGSIPVNVQLPYRQSGERDYFIDAVDSPDYNRWMHIPEPMPNTPKQHWSSFESMRRKDHQYEYGVIVEHNTLKPITGKGSAIFMHVWLNAETATSGCTAMQKTDLLTVMRWLKPSAQPILIQLPETELAKLPLPVH